MEVENKLLHARILDKEERIAELKVQREDLQHERNKWQETANKLLLTYNPVVKSPEKPTEAEDTVSEEEQTPIEKAAQNAKGIVYGIVVAMLLVVTLLMNYFQAEIRAFIDDELLGKPAPHGSATKQPEPLEPAENVEQGRGERGKEPLQSYPPALLNLP